MLGWDGWGIAPVTWTIIMLAAAVIVATLMAVMRRDVAYLAVPVLALIGIAALPDAVGESEIRSLSVIRLSGR